MLRRILILLFMRIVISSNLAEDTFHIRHYNGKCLELRRNKLVFSSVCRHHFIWKGGAMLIHVPTGKCLVPLSSSDGGSVSLTSSCSGMEVLFQHKRKQHAIKHLMSGMCLQPNSSIEDPVDNTELVISAHCEWKCSRFWFIPQVLYVIRHFSGLCWKYSEADDLIKLVDSYVCDRFLQHNNYHLKHRRTGKCVVFKKSHLRLTADCTDPATSFYLDANNLLHQSQSSCVRPNTWTAKTRPDALLLLHACANEDAMRAYFYDDKHIFKIELISQPCNDQPPSLNCDVKGEIKINGHQYSQDTRGMNVVVVDYRSGILEHRSVYDLRVAPQKRNVLAKFLNDLPNDKILFISVKGAVVKNLGSNLIAALQRYGVSAAYASSELTKDTCSMVAVAYTGGTRKSWEESVNQPNCTGTSKIQKRIFSFRDFKGVDDCSEEMGMRAGKIRDSQISAKSYFGHLHESYRARLHKQSSGWCSRYGSPLSDFIQVDFGARRLISGLAIQAHLNGWHYLSQFKLQYSEDGVIWKYYVDETKSAKVFNGIQRLLPGETVTNWFSRVLARFLRIIAVARTSFANKHCVRMEIFGCTPNGPFFHQNHNGNDVSINDVIDTKISFYGIPAAASICIGISTAASSDTLVRATNQYHIDYVNTTITMSNGSIVENAVRITSVKNPARGITKALNIHYDLDVRANHEFEIGFTKKILDTKKETGSAFWNVYVFETEQGTVAISRSENISRKANDNSLLLFQILNKTEETLKDGGALNFSIAISHSSIASHANAYQVQFSIYYDPNHVTLMFVNKIKRNNFTINPTRNTTIPGIIIIQTDTLWLLNNLFIDFKFKINSSDVLAKGNSSAALIVDFAYMSNLAKFDGQINATVGKEITYNYRNTKMHRTLPTVPQRITTPGLSMLFDDINKNLYVCNRKYSRINHPVCFMKEKGKPSWRGIPRIVLLVGIDASEGILFGIDWYGNVYLRLNSSLRIAAYVGEKEWISIQNQPNVRKAKTATDSKSLPNAPQEPFMFPSTEKQLWAATRGGILKNVRGRWKRVMYW